LISRGINQRKIAYCNQPVYFSDSIQSIAAIDSNDSDLLRFLTVVLNSDIAQYYLFHNSTRWAIERDMIYLHEIYEVPFLLPEESSNPKMAQKIVNKVADKIKKFEQYVEETGWFGEEQKRSDESDKLRSELEQLIRQKYYNIDEYESMLIDETIRLSVESFHARQNQAHIPTLEQPKKQNCITYTQTLCEMLNHFGKGSQFKVRGEVFKGMPYSIVQVSLTDRVSINVPITDTKDKLASVIKRMESLLKEKKGPFVFCQNLKVFDADSLYVLKPMQMRFWSRTAAINDADEIAGYILQIRRNS